jgi:thymidylate synthase (FAD)
MGNDSAVVQAARISYGAGTKTPSDDRTLIRYLIRHRHTTPLEMCEAKFHIRIPMDAWRQMIRHRTANINEYSTRYSEAIDAKAVTLPGEWRLQNPDNKQGSSGYLDLENGELLSDVEHNLHTLCDHVYKRRLELGIAREQARKDLPLSTYTEAYWKIDLHNLFHFLSLRLDKHAQLEIRLYAQAITSYVKEWVPICWEAFEDYRLHSITFSRLEIKALRKVVKQLPVTGLIENKRERAEFLAKIDQIFNRED